MKTFDFRRTATLLATTALVACATAPQVAGPIAPPPLAEGPAVPQQAAAAPVSQLVKQVAIPYDSFTLDNGLEVLVHEDHKAPVVAVSVWYNVGSKDEPKGKTGFAHLFEHLLFYGSDNVREPTMPFLESLGATDWNGSTWFDRTNYYQTVPKSALERTLFMESDRMGYLLPAIDQQRLDLQRGVVQNEKRQGDNQPGGLIEYELLAALFPEGHPYRHSTIGSMADLDSASLADVKSWFIDKYGPNNAVVALAGDITPAEARTLMRKYFGAIPRGPANVPAAADVPTLPAPKAIVMKDKVAAIQVQRHWAVPGLLSDDLEALDVGAAVLGGLSSSRLDRILVRDEKIAVSVNADMQPFHRVGMFQINATVKPGVDPALVERRLDEIVAQFLTEGPTQDEVTRAATVAMSGQIRSLEKVGDDGGKASTLAEGQLYADDPDLYRKQLQAYAALTPAQVRGAMRAWLSRPVVTIRLEPGERPPYEEAKGAKPAKGPDIKVPSVKRSMPPLGAPETLDFPAIERTVLANGIPITFARRSAAPLTHVVLSFDAGYAADTPDTRGLQNMVMALLDEGTERLTAQQIAEEKERLGASLATAGGIDRSTVTLSALTANLQPSLDLMTDVVQNAAFQPGEVERIRSQLLTGIQQAKTDPNGIAARALPTLLYGAAHPYGGTSAGDEETVKAFSREQLTVFRDRWLRPDNARLFIVSDRPLAELKPILEQALGNWRAPAAPRGQKSFPAIERPGSTRIVLINRPGSPQSVIYGGQVTPIDPKADNSAVNVGNDVLGGSTASRIYTDLRERKGWSYGAYSYPQLNLAAVPYLVNAPVQADRTGEALKALIGQFKDVTASKGVTPAELTQAVSSNVGALPGQFETGTAVLGALQTIELYGRPDNYYELLAGRYRSLTTAQVDAALRRAIDPGGFTFVVVGDAAKVRPQLAKLGLPVEEMQPR
ncbi:MAG TPA: pitrilysin family protein [Sphingomicrobium sp.]|nr:pitrilysin family protein [Sphingomicrobium sp.]